MDERNGTLTMCGGGCRGADVTASKSGVPDGEDTRKFWLRRCTHLSSLSLGRAVGADDGWAALG